MKDNALNPVFRSVGDLSLKVGDELVGAGVLVFGEPLSIARTIVTDVEGDRVGLKSRRGCCHFGKKWWSLSERVLWERSKSDAIARVVRSSAWEAARAADWRDAVSACARASLSTSGAATR